MVGITISFGGISSDIPKTERTEKGKSYIAFPSEYCVLDLETTGLSPEWDQIIEIGAIKYANGQEVDRYQTLVQPEPYDDGIFVDAFIEELTGITNEMLADAPKIDAILGSVADFLGDLPIVGYNVNFDINFLYDNFVNVLDKPFTNNYIDGLRMARKLYPDMKHHRLQDMVALFGLDNIHAHRTISDCEATNQCYSRFFDEAIRQYGSVDGFISLFKHKSGYGFKAADIHGDESKTDPSSPLFGKYCVFTGKLEKFTRKEAMQIVADLGGINEDNVTKKTNFLVLGNNDYCATIKDGKSSKQKKAEKNKLAGQDIEIVPETVFYDMLEET